MRQILLLLIISASVICIQEKKSYQTTINPSVNWGTWEGWGVSLCWWAKVFGQRDDLADIFFSTKETLLKESGQNLPGLGLNIARYNAGASSTKHYDGQQMQVSENIIHSRQIDGYWLDWSSDDVKSDSWDFSRDQNQRQMAMKARDRGVNHIELFSNSPMWWMLNNHNPSGSDLGFTDNLQSWNYQNHTKYLTKIAKYARDNWNINFKTVEPFNEPISGWWNSKNNQEGCHFAESTQKTIINYLRSQLDSEGLNDVLISSSDENEYDQAQMTWNSFDQETQSKIGQVNTHGYQEGGGRRDLLYDAVKGKAKLWNSEYGENDVSGLKLTSNLNLDFRWLHNTAWVYWQALDGGGWGLIDADVDNQKIEKASTKYFVLAQYTRHIKPGYQIIDGGEGNTIAAYDSQKKKLVIVTTNYQDEQQITFDLSQFSQVNGPVTRWQTKTDGSEQYKKYQDTQISAKKLTSNFSANTIQTFEIENVEISSTYASFLI